MHVQLALDGRWSDARTPGADLRSWLATAREHIGIEYFLDREPPHGRFFGLRLPAYEIERALDLVHTPPSLTFEGTPDALEVGIVNAWQERGACRIWNRGDACPSLDRCLDLLRATPHLLEPQPLPLAIEAVYDHRWRALPVSAERNGVYQLQPDLLQVAIVELL